MQRTINVYRLKELKEAFPIGYERALDELRQLAYASFPHDEIARYVADYLEENYGYQVSTPEKGCRPNIYWHYSLGFSGRVKSLPEMIRKFRREGKLTGTEAAHLLKLPIVFVITNTRRETSCELEMDHLDLLTDLARERALKLYNLLQTDLEDACRGALRLAQEREEDETDEENLVARAEDQDVLFTHMGNRVEE